MVNKVLPGAMGLKGWGNSPGQQKSRTPLVADMHQYGSGLASRVPALHPTQKSARGDSAELRDTLSIDAFIVSRYKRLNSEGKLARWSTFGHGVRTKPRRC